MLLASYNEIATMTSYFADATGQEADSYNVVDASVRSEVDASSYNAAAASLRQ